MTVTAERVRAVEAAFGVTGMDCASCVAHVERAARTVAGVQACEVNLARGRAVAQFDPDKTNPNSIASAISSSGYVAIPEATVAPQATENERLNRQRQHTRSWL